MSRPPAEILAEAQWLASSGARELVLVSENSTSYGKDLGDLRSLEKLLPDLAAVDGIERIRVSYLQPAELRPSLLAAIADTPGVAPYFDLSFQHASETVLRRMKRFGNTESFLSILAQARAIAPEAGARSNVIVGFPGETEADVEELARFLTEARLDLVGVFGYSDEDGTDAYDFDGKLPDDEIAARVAHISSLCEELMSQRAEDRIGTAVEVLVEDAAGGIGRALHQGPDVDGTTRNPGRLGHAWRTGERGGRRQRWHRLDRAVRRGDSVTPPPQLTGSNQWMGEPVEGDPIADPPSAVSAWNLANALTVLRLALVPVFLVVLFRHDGHSTGWRFAAWAVFAVASITDRFDGELARKRGLITEFGKLADPIADKALVGAALIGLSALSNT